MALTQVDIGLLNSNAQYTGFKNRIINGAMVIDQRNAGASVNANAARAFGVDRFAVDPSASMVIACQRTTTVPTTVAGFINSLSLTVSTAKTPVAADVCILRQDIEGLNCADLGWGSANAAPITLSFWVRSSITGTYSVAFRNSAFNRSYIATYSISSANTWEQKTISIAGDTSGTWLTTNGIGIDVVWDLGSGFNYNGTAGSWSATAQTRTSGTTSWIATSGATFYITGVQLEKGGAATAFDYRPYGTELVLCQRYFEKSYNYDVAVATSTDTGTVSTRSPQADMQDTIQFAVEKRSGPDIVYYTGLGVINNWRDVSVGVNKGMATAVTGSRQFTWANVKPELR